MNESLKGNFKKNLSSEEEEKENQNNFASILLAIGGSGKKFGFKILLLYSIAGVSNSCHHGGVT